LNANNGVNSLDQAQINTARNQEKQVWVLANKNQLKQAIMACQNLNQQFPGFAPGWHAASQLAIKTQRLDAALRFTEIAIELEPDQVNWLIQKAVCLWHSRQFEPLNTLVDELVSRQSLGANHYSTLGLLLTQLERREEAISFYQQAAKLKPGNSQHFYNMAVLQRSLGEIDNAERNLDRAISLNPADYEAFKVRSELKKQTAASNHVKAMEKLLKRGIKDPRGKANVCFALAKELEDMEEWDRSFRILNEGAKTRRSYMEYTLQRDLDTMVVIRQSYGSDLFDGHIEGSDNSEAIFILGMPRTGTTLVERILASHSDVFPAGELGNFAMEMMAQVRQTSLNRKPDRDELVRLTTELDFRKLGDAYIASTRPSTGHTPRFIDKLPLNYLYVGLIHLALPNAKIINLRRHPMDTCYAIYKQLFVDGYPFSYNLEELAQYFAAYHRLMEHWNAVLPGVIHTVNYEDLVADVEGESKRLLQFCELDWQQQVLKFYQSKAASTTASSTQVRQPVYRSSVAKWKRYEEQLEPLARIFKEAGIALD